MKKILLFIFFLASGLSFAQFDLEHTYDQGVVVRVKLEFAGEKYYIHDRINNRVDLYNPDHTFWKSIETPVPPQGYFVGLSNVSDGTINDDENIEVIYAYYQSGFVGGTYYSKVISEDGSELLSLSNCNFLFVDETPGFAPKLISYGTEKNVYSLPGLALEHTYATTGVVYRTVLENSGEKYYYLDAASGQAKLFNPDHSVWKSVNLPKPVDGTYTSVSFISETAVNADAQLEVGYSYYTNTGGFMYTDKIVNEAGNVLLTLPGNFGLQLSKVSGLESKLFAYDGPTTKIYQLPSLAIEHTYTGTAARTVLDVSGEKYYVTNNENQLLIYNSDHSLWKTIALPTPDDRYRISSVNGIYEHKFDQDNQVEVVYTALDNTLLELFYYESRIVKENGQVLLSVPGASYLYLNQWSGLDAKLIANLSGDEQAEANIGGKVYGIDNAMHTIDFGQQSDISVYPNPVASVLHINSKTAVVEASVYNTLGVKVKHFEGENLSEFPMETLATGTYFIRLTDSTQAQSTHKIIVTH